MNGFSQPERRGLERLQIPKPESHPDADLLTAFAEHSLSVRENEQVLSHLAVCSHCRDAVALAGSQLVEPVPEPARKRGIWEMPLFHWGAVAATAVVVVFAVSLGLRQKTPAPESSRAVFNEQLPASQADKVVAESSAKVAEALAKQDPDLIHPAAPANTSKRAVHLQQQIRYEKVVPPQSKEKGQPALKAPTPTETLSKVAAPPPPPISSVGGAMASRDAVAASAGKDERADLKQAPAAKKAEPQNAPSPASVNAYAADETLSVTAQAPSVSQMNSAGITQPNEVQSANSVVARSAPTRKAKTDKMLFHEVSPIKSVTTGTEWQITNEGGLQRSYNFGGTWENMLSDRRFRAVAVVRDHVWAGGDNGMLYYSSDNGRNWASMPVRNATGDASGNIIRLRFDDLQNGSLDTSTGETWKTNDGGQTWHKQ